MSRHALVLADIEGIIGVHRKGQCTPGSPLWKKARQLITSDVNAAISGLLEAGFSRITVFDMHGTGFNILPEALHPAACLHQGHSASPVPLLGKIPSAQLAVMVGWHAARDQKGFSPHMFHKKLKKMTVNGAPITEVELFAAVLAEHGIPTAFVSAEKVACARIQKNMPQTATLAIAKSPLSLPQAKALRAALKEGVKKAASKKPPPLFCWTAPFKATVWLTQGPIHLGPKSATDLFRQTLFCSVLDFKPRWAIPPLLAALKLTHRAKEALRLRAQKKPPQTKPV